jgi:hypothetical protein
MQDIRCPHESPLLVMDACEECANGPTLSKERGVPEQPSLWERSPCDWLVRVFSSVSPSE